MQRPRWIERLLALLALLNLCFVLFDSSYLSSRDFYLATVPTIPQFYDQFKGIQPHPETQFYLKQVDRFSEQIAQSGLQVPETQQQLATLQQLSQRLISENAFEDAGSSSFARIKQALRDRTDRTFGSEALTTFWSVDYWSTHNWQEEINYFSRELRPLIAANFTREIDRYGKFVDRFWLIDLPFVSIFAIDFLTRTLQVRRRRPDLTLIEAMLRRWFDLLLLLPFWRWLRVLPVTLRLHHANLLSIEPIRTQINHDFAINFAQHLTEMIGIQVVDQMQEAIQRGDAIRWLIRPNLSEPYVEVNPTNEVGEVAAHVVKVSIYDVLPQVQPEFEQLISHTITTTLHQMPAYQQLTLLPGVGKISTQLIDRAAKETAQTLYQNLYKNLVNVVEDPIGAELVDRFRKTFRDVLEEELQKQRNLQKIQPLLVDLLEEIKINYVTRIAQGNTEKAVEETEQLHRKYYLG